MDSESVKRIIKDIHSDYDLEDADDITQLIINLLFTFDKRELEDALIQINILEEEDK